MNKYNKATWLIFVPLFLLISIACRLTSPLAGEKTPSATPLPYPADWQLLLADDFNDNSNEWASMVPDTEAGSISSKVENGVLDVTLRSKDQVARNTVFQSKVTHLMDFYISFEAEQKELGNDAYFGLEFRTINLQGYVFMIDQKHSQYSLAFTDAGWHPIIDFTTSTAINSDKPNKIGLLLNGATITMFINDQEIAKISDSRSAWGTFGFTVGSFNPNEMTNITFDNLQIYGPSTLGQVPTLMAPRITYTPATYVPPVMPTVVTREQITMTSGGAVLEDQLLYFRSISLPLATAVPKNPNDTFLVILLALPSNSTLYPADLDWTVLDETKREFKSVGISVPKVIEEQPEGPVVITFFGRLMYGTVNANSNRDYTLIALIYVVPKEIEGVTLLNPQKQQYSVTILPGPFSLEGGLKPNLSFNPSSFKQPDGSEDWTFTP
ncbi:MAG: hypothetical protein ACOYZ6_05515 [Chloroflexota bacterium]